MKNMRRMVCLHVLVVALTVGLGGAGSMLAQEPDAADRDRELPPHLAPLEFLIGSWKGQGLRKDDPALRFRGWTEVHSWAWIFDKGKPVGLKVVVQDGKILESGTLRFDQERKEYRLEGKSGGMPVLYTGELGSSKKLLTLNSSGSQPLTTLSLRANSNYIRYTLWLASRDKGSAVAQTMIEVGLTKQGESFAAGSTALEQPRCIVTGGSATMTLSYQGKSYPICCSGCRDEFTANPQKYLKKLSMRSSGAESGKSSGQPRAGKVSRFDDAFGSDVDDSMPSSKTDSKGVARSSSEPSPTRSDDQRTPAKRQAKPEPAKGKGSGAATSLRIAQNLEKSGKSSQALKLYRQIVKDYPGSSQSKIASMRIMVIEKE